MRTPFQRSVAVAFAGGVVTLMGSGGASAIVSLSCVTVGCHGSESSPPSIDTAKNLGDLSADDRKALCDWTAQEFGGYDSRGVCIDSAGGGLQGPTDPTGCLDMLLGSARCSATIAEFQACIEAEVKAACNWPPPSPLPECVRFGPGCATSEGGASGE